jgi:hypothetical protein
VTPDQKMEIFVAIARMAQAVADESPPEILREIHTDIGLALDQLPPMPADLTDDAAKRDHDLIDAAEELKLGLGPSKR